MSRNVSDTSPAASASAARSRSRPKVAETGSVLLRGGRLTRVAGVVASYAPALGRARPALLTSVSALALGAAAFLGLSTTEALSQASNCTDAGGTGTLTCSGNITTQVNLTGAGNPQSVEVDPSAIVTIGTSENNRDGEAFYLNNTNSISFTQSSATQVITGNTKAVYLLKKSGVGPVSISAAGSLVGRTGDSVVIIHNAVAQASERTTVNVASVTGGLSGVNVAKYGGGPVTITATRSVIASGTGSTMLEQNGISLPGAQQTVPSLGKFYNQNAAGIRVWTSARSGAAQAGDISVSAATVTAAGHGVYAKSLKGGVSIVATGTVTSSGSGSGAGTPNWAGIYAYSSSTAGISITAANVTASSVGIRAVTASDTNGNIAIRSDGTISAGTKGVEAVSGGTGTITVNVGTVNSSGIGIEANGGNGGNVSISANTVSAAGSTDAAIMATSSGAGNITITAGQVTAGSTGIHAASSGSGNIAVTATGTVTASGWGIRVINGSGGGAVEINASGSVSSSGTTSKVAAIYASASDSITITASGVVRGAKYGIYAHHSGSGTNSVAINVSGKVTGGTSGDAAAIRTNVSESSATVAMITLESGAAVGEAGSAAIKDGDGKSVVTAKAGSTISGTVDLDAGDDEFVITGAAVTGDVDFGGGDDTFNISGGAVTISGALDGGSGSNDKLLVTEGTVALGSGTDATMEGWETITIGGSAGASEATVNVMGTAGGSVGFNANSTVVLKETGTISMENDIFTRSAAGADEFANGLQLHNLTGENGTIVLDVNFGNTSQSDKIAVRGTIRGTTYVDFRPTGNLPADPKVNNAFVNFAFVGSGATNESFKARGDYKIEFDGNTGVFKVKYSPAACEETTTGSGIFVCDRNISTTQTLTTSGTTHLVVNLSNAGEVSAGASIITAAGDALKLTQTSGARNITFTQSGTGAITGAEHAINVQNAGSGAVSINTTGTVTGGTGSAISVYNARETFADAGSNVTISAAGLLTSSKADAVNVFNGTSGTDLSVTVATVTTTAPDVDKTRPATTNTASATYVISYSAIRAENAGTGALTVVATGSVSSMHGTAIHAANRGHLPTSGDQVRGTNVVVTTGTVSGGRSGIVAYNSGTGSVTVTATGAITANRGFGVDATNRGTGALTVSVTTVSANDGLSAGDAEEGSHGGIRAINDDPGTGKVDVSATGDVSTDQGHGIYAATWAGDGAVTITAAGVSAGGSGIRAVASGNGGITVSATGIVSSAGTAGKSVGRSPQQENRIGPLVLNGTTVNDDAFGNFDAGIYASATGAGAISVTARAVTASGFGVYATGNADIDISVASVTAGGDGVVARNSSGGSISIDASDVTAGNNAAHRRFSTGIFAHNASTASAGVTVTAADVTGGAIGIFAKNEGSGMVSVTAGTVSTVGETMSGLTLSGTGVLSVPAAAVYASNDSNTIAGSGGQERGEGVSISVNSAMGNGHGIYAINRGTGDLEITASSSVVSNASVTDFTGITALHTGTSGSLMIQAGAVTSVGGDAIYAKHFGATTSSSATISVATVTAGGHGIYLNGNRGTGPVSVTATGDITATSSQDPTKKGVFVTYGSGNNTMGATSMTISVANVAASGDAIYAKSKVAGAGSGSLTVAANTVSGGGSGIHLHNSGGGLVSLTVAGSVSATGTGGDSGVRVINASGGGVWIDLQNEVTTSGGHGIRATNAGLGDIMVMATGKVTATSSLTMAHGVRVDNSENSGSSVTINVSNVEASGHGIQAKNMGTGGLTISATSVSAVGSAVGSKDGHAIYANNASGGDLDISVTGQISNVSSATMKADEAVKAINSGGNGGLSISVATVSSLDGGGIYASNSGGGDLMINATGSVASTGSMTSGVGIFASATGTGALTISATAVTAGGDAIYAFNKSGGDLMITASGNVMATGSLMSGIMAVNEASTSSLTIMAQDVEGGAYGVHATSSGSGGMFIVAGAVKTTALNLSGTSEQADSAGVYAKMNASGALSIAVDSATGDTGFGIKAMHAGNGSLTITSSGAVTSSGPDPRYDESDDEIANRLYGIHAENKGDGDIEITASGLVSAAQGGGIMAKSAGSGTVTVSVATVTANAGYGVKIVNSSNGSVSVTTSGAVKAVAASETKADGIFVTNSHAQGSSVTVNAAAKVEGPNHGIRVLSTGTNNGGISIMAQDVESEKIGIFANNSGGAVSVVVAGSVNVTGSGTDAIGIRAINVSSNAKSITVEAAQINAANAGFGIKAEKKAGPEGSVSIKTTGSVSAIGSNTEGVAIFASAASGSDMTIDASGGLVSGGKHGIQANHNGTGPLTISATSVSAANDSAIHATLGSGSSGSLSINAGTVTASGSVTSVDDVNDGKAAGIFAMTEASGGITITAANVSANGGHGIRAKNEGSGAITINLTGTASSNSGTATAIFAENNSSGSSITVNAASVNGAGSGIKAVNRGSSGATSVTATTVNVSGMHGIDVASFGSGNIDITATTVSAGEYGIKANNSGGGSIFIDAGSVSLVGSATDDVAAINARNSDASGSSITVNVASASGEGYGVKIDNGGDKGVVVHGTAINVGGASGIHVMNEEGSISITAGTVTARGTGSAAAGIHAVNNGDEGLTITATSVAGGGHGINAYHRGNGVLSISVGSANSSGTDADHAAIRAKNSSSGSDLTITATSVEGVVHGVHATNIGGGALSIRVGSARSTGTAADSHAIYADHTGLGALTVSAATADSASGKGIHAEASSSRSAITVTAARVRGGTHGVFVKHRNDGKDVEVTITESLSVSGSNGIGIATETNGGDTKVVIARNATVTASGADALAIKTDDGDATITVNAGANVTGGIQTGAGEDRVTLQGDGIRFTGDIDLETGGEEEDHVTLSGDGITVVGSVVLGKGPDSVTVNGDNIRIEGDIELGLTGDSHANTLTLSGNDISIDGNISLGDGTDQLTFSGRNISVGETIDFGRGNDSLSFGVGATTIASLDGGSGGEAGVGDVLTFQRGSDVTLNGSNPLRNWESVVAREGSMVRFDGKQTLESKELTFEQGSVLSMKDGATNDELTMQVVSFTGHGKLEIDVDFAGGAADKLIVARNTIYDPEQRTGNVIDGRVTENTPHSPTQIVMHAIPASGDVEPGTKIRVAEVEGDLKLEGESGAGRGFIFAKGDGNSVPGDTTRLYVGAFELRLELERESDGNDHTFDVNVVDKRVNDAGAILEMAPSVIVSRFATPPSLSKRTFGRQIAAFDGMTFGPVSQNFSEGNRIIGAGAGESWIRAYGEVVDFGRSTSGADTESVGYGVQAGADVASYELGGGDLVMGLAGQYGTVTADVTSNNHRNGEISTSGYGVGAIASWFGTAGLYVDVQTQINWLESDLTSSSAGVLATGNETSAVFTSVEIGRRFAFGSNGAVVPQAQFSRGQVDTDPFENGPNFEVKFGNETAVIARLGMAAEFTDANGKGYLTANILHDFSETRSVEISGTKLRDQSDSTMLEVGLGGSVAVSDRSIIFVEGSYKSAIGGDGNDERSTGLSGGFQWKW